MSATPAGPTVPYYAAPTSPPRMHYMAAYRFLFGSPNGWTNLLYLSICVLIPYVGIVVVMGYLTEVFVPRVDENWRGWSGEGDYPDFDFGRFVRYLERGLWPFLVSLVAQVVIAVPAYLLLVVGVIIAGAVGGNGVVAGSLILLTVVFFLAVVVGLSLLIIPLILRGAILQEFVAAFSFEWARDFLARTWRELILAVLVEVGMAIPLTLAGVALCFIGVYVAVAVLVVAQWHLYFQTYRVYLAHGGSRLVAKGAPPPLPTAS